MKAWSWRLEAQRAILAALETGKSQGLTGRELERFVSQQGYPFGPRKMYPYKVWLNEFSRLVRGRKKRMSTPRPKRPTAGPNSTVQGSFWGSGSTPD